MFDANPEKYLVAYDGWCATGVAQGMKLASDPKLFTLHEGRTYLFSDASAKEMFQADKAGTIARADANWPKVAKQRESGTQ
jgi:YHS domain-containing protein